MQCLLARMFGCDYRFVCDAHELDAIWKRLGTDVLLPRDEVASAFYKLSGDDIVEVWASWCLIPCVDALYCRMK